MASADVSFSSEFPGQPHPERREAREPTEVGRRIADRYQIEQLQREDASTITVIARHLTLEERVQVQVLRSEQRFDPQISAQYLAACKALAHIKTDHVARVLDVGVALYLGPFLVLEALEGNTLAQVLGTEGALPIPRAVSYVLQACKGLAVAHAAGVVHGQLSPSCLLLARRGEFETLEVTDFPTLDLPAEEQGRVYSAPEVSSRLTADRRADVWSLGAVLYELVTGSPLAARAAGEPLEHAALTPALRAIIARCLQPDVGQRFEDVEQLAAELLPLTTMNEVFRGSLTGSFSRQMMMAAAAQARADAALKAGAAAQPRAEHPWLRPLRAALPVGRWTALAQSWEVRKPQGAPALPQALAGAAVLLLAVGSALLSDFTLRPPPPTQDGVAPSVVQAALLPAAGVPSSAQPSAPPAPEPAAQQVAQAEPVLEPAAVEPAVLEPAPGGSAVAGQPATGLLPGQALLARDGTDAVREPTRAERRRAARAAAAKKRATREGRATAKRRERRQREEPSP
jgi:serine/threonine-protein kinase